MKQYLIVLFFLGIIMAILGHYQSNTNCPKEKIQYKFIDKSIEEAQKSGMPSVYNQFIPMFTDAPILI